MSAFHYDEDSFEPHAMSIILQAKLLKAYTLKGIATRYWTLQCSLPRNRDRHPDRS